MAVDFVGHSVEGTDPPACAWSNLRARLAPCEDSWNPKGLGFRVSGLGLGFRVPTRRGPPRSGFGGGVGGGP